MAVERKRGGGPRRVEFTTGRMAGALGHWPGHAARLFGRCAERTVDVEGKA